MSFKAEQELLSSALSMKWEKIILVIVSAFLSVVMYLLLPIELGKFQLSLTSSFESSNLYDLLYEDMDSDEEIEYIRCKKADPLPSFVVHRKDLSIIGQWNLNGVWVASAKIQTTDLDGDGYREVIGFTYYRDSVWIHVIEPLQVDGMNIHMTTDCVHLIDGKQDWRISSGHSADLNGDGCQEYLFTIGSGYTKFPRRLYKLDPVQEKLEGSDPFVGSKISNPLVLDLDGDSKLEIAVQSSASGNISDPKVPYPDSCSWLFVFDQEMKFKTPPRSYPGSPSYTYVQALKDSGKDRLVCFHLQTIRGIQPKTMDVFGWKGDSLHLMASRTFVHDDQVVLLSNKKPSNNIGLLFGSHHIGYYNVDLEEINQVDLDLDFDNVITIHSLDIDQDGKVERLFNSGNKWLTIMTSDYSHPVAVNLGISNSKPTISSFVQDGKGMISLFRAPLHQIFEYSKNPLYPLRYIFLVLIFVVYYFLLTQLLRWQRRAIEKKQQIEKELLNYQLKNVRQQLDPHFLFNAMTGISSYYRKGESSHAQRYLAKVSRMMLYSLENSEKMSITLEEELDFVKNYLSVESIRLGERFGYSVDVEENSIGGHRIPKMLVQNFVENALKHGLSHLTDTKGILQIYSKREDGFFLLIIEDNGIGRAKAKEIGSKGTGNGMRMIDRTLEIFHQLKKVKINYEIVDLADDSGKASGTYVMLKFPLTA